MAEYGKHQSGGGGLNGAYYGPQIPPPNHKSYRSIGRSSPCCCSPCSLLCSIIKLLIGIVVFLGIIVLVLWLVFRPSELKSYVESATLTRFELDNNTNTLVYNLTLDVSIRNPNKRVAIYYDRLQAYTVYDGFRFGFDDSLPVFFQGHKNTTDIYPSFNGQQQIVVVGSTPLTTFAREKGEGWFHVDLTIETKVRFKVWFIKTNSYKPKIECGLGLPVPSSSNVFTRTKCHVNFF